MPLALSFFVDREKLQNYNKSEVYVMTEAQKLELFYQQKKTLDTFLQNGAITQAQYNKSYGDLVVKMNIPAEALKGEENR